MRRLMSGRRRAKAKIAATNGVAHAIPSVRALRPAEIAIVEAVIARVTAKVARHGYIRCQDRDDLRNDLWVAILDRWPIFRSAKGSMEAFANLVVSGAGADVLRRHRAKKHKSRISANATIDEWSVNSD